MTLSLHGFPDWQRQLHTADLFASTTTTVLNSNTQVETPLLDMRAYSSFTVFTTQNLVAAPTAYGHVYISATWYNDAAGMSVCFRDTFRLFPYAAFGGAFDVADNEFSLTDIVHGPFFQVVLRNMGPDQITANVDVTGNSRTVGGRSVRHSHAGPFFNQVETSAPLLSVSTVLAAGATYNAPMRLSPGPTSTGVDVGAGGGFLFSFSTPGSMAAWRQNFVAGSYALQSIILPQEACLFSATNTGAVPNNFIAVITSAPDQR